MTWETLIICAGIFIVLGWILNKFMGGNNDPKD